MIKNTIKTAFRFILKYKLYSIINIVGLTVGMAAVLLINLYIEEEAKFDKFHVQGDRLYRATVSFNSDPPTWAGTPAPMAPLLTERFSEIESAIRIDPFGFNPKFLISHQDISFYESRFMLADPGFFEAFSFHLLKGDPSKVLSGPTNVVISESTAEKYFGDEDPIGKILVFDGRLEMVVSGVMADVPRYSHLQFDLVGSYEHINQYHGWTNFDVNQSWGMFNYYTYLLLSEGSDRGILEEKMGGLVKELRQEEAGGVYLQRIEEIHLQSNIERDPLAKGSISNLYLYGSIAIMILIIACINFTSLYTANSEVRAKEVGIRKVLGAQKKQVVFQFLGEAFILSFVALPLAVALVQLIMPSFNTVFQTSISFESQAIFQNVVKLVLLVLAVGIIAGIYPAFFISSYQPVRLLQNQLSKTRKKITFRNILVVMQFMLSIVLIIGAFTIGNQMDFILNSDLGYDPINILNIPLSQTGVVQRYNLYKEQIVSHANILDVTATSFTPSIERWREGSYFEGRTEEDDQAFFRMSGDYNVVDMLKIDLLAGRSFQENISSDLYKAWILNESAVRSIGWSPEEAVGKRFGGQDGRIVGVVNDFHFRSFRKTTEPLAMNVIPRMFRYVSIRYQPGDIPGLIQFLETKWQQVNPGIPFEYYFFESEFAVLYRNDLNTKSLFTVFTAIAIFLACLGLFGLSLYTIQRRTKEIGIRKVLGARFSQTSKVLVADFIKLVLMAYVIAIPLAYIGMNRWLEGFVYRTGINPLVFVLSGLAVFALTILTVSMHVIKVSRTNPADVLKYE